VAQTVAGQSVQGNLAAFRVLRAQQAAQGRALNLDISIGGWTRSVHFSGCARTGTGRALMVATTITLLRDIEFDGVDIDWEYPVCCGDSGNEYHETGGVSGDRTRNLSKRTDAAGALTSHVRTSAWADWDNYLLLLAEYRQALDNAFPGEHRELTIAMGMGPLVTGRAPKRQLAELVDCVNLMTYDYNGAWAALSGHNADPAYATAGGQAEFNIDWGVRQWLDAGVPASKLVLGLPSYGRGWVGTVNQYGQGSGGVSGSPPWFEPGLLSYWDIAANYVGSSTYTRHWNSASLWDSIMVPIPNPSRQADLGRRQGE
jgi:GH18 family chitinase